MTFRFHIHDVSLGYRNNTIIEQLDLGIHSASLTAIIGPNGCGKSTLLKGLGRVLHPLQGEILLDGQNLLEIPTKQVAQKVSILPQTPIAPAGITARGLVERGRFPHRKWWDVLTTKDREIVDEALTKTGLVDLADTELNQLSGGQKQRAWIAMNLAQRSEIMLLDEPTNHLDLAHQLEVMELIRAFPDQGTTVVVLHDLSLAARYADRIIAMNNGTVVGSGLVREVFNTSLVEATFGLHSKIYTDKETGLPVVLPLT